MDTFDIFDELNKIDIPKHPWMDECTFILGTNENLASIIDHCLEHPRVATDLETTGLDNRVFNGTTVDKIVGLCLCPDGKTGYYIPLRHRVNPQANVSWTLFVEQFQRLVEASLAKKLVFVFHGGQFDMEFLEFNGDVPLGADCWDSPACWCDTEIQAYLLDSRRRDKRLKSLSKQEVGIEQLELNDLWTEEERSKKGFRKDFADLDPRWEGTLLYGGGDGIATWRLDALFYPQVSKKDKFGHDLNLIYKIEKKCVAATRWMKRNRIKIDRKKVEELIKLGQQEWFDSIMEVYDAASEILGRDAMPGHYKQLRDTFNPNDMLNLISEQHEHAKVVADRNYPDPKQRVTSEDGKSTYPYVYDVNAPTQLGVLFEEMGVPNLVRTENSGQVKTSKDILDKIVENNGKDFPFMGKIKRFREISKALTNYLIPMLRESDPSDDTIAINFRGHKVDTGRFATPAKQRISMRGWPGMNLQSIPATYDPNRPECMRRLRECIIGRDGKFLVAIDYAGVELRLVTNLSLEPKWLTEYFRCSECSRTFDRGTAGKTPDAPPPRCPNCGSDKIGDLHTLTGIEVYGPDAPERKDWKQLRQRAKGSNFALCYGGGGNAVMRSTGCDKQEGWRIKNLFDKSYKDLRSWWGKQHNFARQREYVLTGFGRRYPVPDINHGDGGFRSKAERNAVNGPIQGTSADITKMAMGLIYKEVKNRGWLDKVLMTITMHDELVFEIDPDVLEEAIEVIKHVMCSNRLVLSKNWPVPLTSDVEIGFDWSVPWDLNSMRAGECRFDGDKKYYKASQAEADGLQWEALSAFPASLAPYFKGQTFATTPSPSQDVGAVPVTKTNTVTIDDVQIVQAAGGPPRGLKSGDAFVYELSAPLNFNTLVNLATVIRQCRGKGTKVLQVTTGNGIHLHELPEWQEYVSDGSIYVNSDEFYYVAKSKGL